MVLTTPLPSVESACSLIQQEESQRELLESGATEFETTALYNTIEEDVLNVVEKGIPKKLAGLLLVILRGIQKQRNSLKRKTIRD